MNGLLTAALNIPHFIYVQNITALAPSTANPPDPIALHVHNGPCTERCTRDITHIEMPIFLMFMNDAHTHSHLFDQIDHNNHHFP